MTICVVVAGVLVSLAGFAGVLLGGHSLHHAVLVYSMVGFCAAITFMISAAMSALTAGGDGEV